jgi:hypothetical protein
MKRRQAAVLFAAVSTTMVVFLLVWVVPAAAPLALLLLGLVIFLVARGWPTPHQRRRADPPSRAFGGKVLSRRALLIAGGGVAVAAVAAMLIPRGVGRLPPSPQQPAVPLGPPRTGAPRREPAGIWISPDELAGLPTDREAFDRLRSSADGSIEAGDVSDQDSDGPSKVMAAALVAVTLNDERLRGHVRDALLSLIGTEDGSTGGHPDRNRPLGIGRNLPGFVIAADLIDLRSLDSSADRRFRSWLDQLRTKRVRGADRSLVEAEPLDHSNWGAYQSAAMTAANLYLDDRSAIDRSAHILRGWLGDPQGSQEWVYDTDRHDYSWQCHYPDIDRFLPVNPSGCDRDGFDLSGIIPIDMQRGGGFRVPPRFTRYPRESLHGRTVQGELLHRAGFPVWEWAERAFWRIAERQRIMAQSFDPGWYEPRFACYWIIAKRYDAHLPLEAPAVGRSVVGVDWTHASDGLVGLSGE